MSSGKAVMPDSGAGRLVNRRYRLEELLGKGAAGEVYRASDLLRGGAELALKLLSARSPGHTARDSLRTEFYALSRLRHPHLVAVHDLSRDRESGHWFLTLEFIDGTTLTDWRAGSRAEFETLAGMLLRAVDFIHRRGFVHADLKPDNILMPREGLDPRISDFGLAGALDLPAARRGTLPYTAPEVLRGDAPGRPADIYSLGATLYQTAYGQPPFTGATPDVIIDGHLRREPSFPDRDSELVPPGLPIILRRMLAKDPADRPVSGEEVISALADLTGTVQEEAEGEPEQVVLHHGSLIGRKDELTGLQARLTRLAAEQPGGVIHLRGAAGVGRSRMLDEIRILAQLEGITVLRAQCREDDQDPFQPLHSTLADLLALSGEPASQEVERLLGTGTDLPDGQDGDRLLIHEAAAELMRAAARAVPLLLVVDDLHHGHPDLLALLLHMIRGCQGLPALTMFSTQSTDGATAAPGSLGAILETPDLESLELPPLSDQESRELVRSHLGAGSLPDEVLEELVHGQQGRPYFLVETMRTLVDSRALERDASGHWRLQKDRMHGSSLPDSSRRVEALRDTVSSTAWNVLTSLSVARQPVAIPDLRDLVGPGQLPLRETLDHLVERGVLARDDTDVMEPAYRFTQALIRDAVYGELVTASPPEGRRLHRARQQQLRHARPLSPQSVAELSFHAEELGLDGEAADLHLELARTDARRGAPGEAARHFSRALELMTRAHAPSSATASIWEELGDVNRLASRPEGADRAYTTAMEQTEEDDHQAQARLLWKRATVRTLAGDPDEARRLLGQARGLARESGDRATLGRCFNALGNSYARDGDHLRAERFFRRALRVRRELGDEVDISGSLANMGMVISFQGKKDAGRRLLREALAISQGCEDARGIAMVANNLGILAAGRGNLDEAEERFREAEQACAAHGALGRRAECLLNLAGVLTRKGVYHQAVEMAREGLELRRRLGLYGETTEALAAMGRAYRESGRVEAAVEAHERALATARRHADPIQEAFALLALAGDELARGDARAARERLDQLPEAGTKNTRLRHRTLMMRAHLLLVTGATAEAGKLADSIPAEDVETWDAADLLDLRLLALRAAITQARFAHCLEEIQQLEEAGRLDHHPARRWELLRLRASALSGLSREDEAAAAHQQAVVAFRDLTEGLPPEYRAALQSSQAGMRMSRDRGSAAPGRVAPGQFLDTMYQVIEALTSVTDADAMLERIMGLALDLLGAERGLILMFPQGGGDPRVAVARNVEDETIADAITYSCQVVDQGRLGRSLVAPDARLDPRLRDYASVSLFQIRSVICVPLQARNRVLGTVYLDSRSRVIGFNDDDLRFLEAFAQHAATALDNAAMLRALQRENLTLRRQVLERYSFANIVGRSQAMLDVFETLRTVSSSPLPALIRGESGTGKELVARALHYNSQRKSGPFLSENCAAFPENLLESQLFGHVRGAFTGAASEQTGLFQEAHGGTLFLDEVGEMSPSLQARLTRVLESGEFRPIGASQPVHVDVRVIGATHRDLEAMVESGAFRRDLLFRLNVISIDLPPLRQRREDIPLLASHFIEELARELHVPPPGISDGALELLAAREWRGNVRQLRNEISRLLVFHRGDVITAEHVRDLSPAAFPPLDDYLEPSGNVVALKDLEKQHILRALDETRGDRTRAARLLRMGRATIFRKIKDYGLDV